MLARMVGAATLDANAYEEVEHDSTATIPAAVLVALAGAATGLGQGLGDLGPAALLGSVVLSVINALLGWYVWALITLAIGARLFNGSSDQGQMLRALGFATAPRLLNVFAFVPILGGVVLLVTTVWTLVTGVVAVRQALDFDTGRAIGTVIVGYIAQIALAFLFGLLAFALGMGAGVMG